MVNELSNWKTQIRKGYLELCILLLIKKQSKMYGSEILSSLKQYLINVKEGTLYPLLKRMADDKILVPEWKTKNNQGHPRKYYALTDRGQNILENMQHEFTEMVALYDKLRSKN